MVDISNKLNQIKALIDQKMYFTINRASQYSKITTLNALRNLIKDEYIKRHYSTEVGLWLNESVTDFDLLGDTYQM